MVVLGLHYCTGLSLAAESKAHSLVATCRLLTAMASLVVKHRLQGLQTPAAVVRGLISWSSQALEQGFGDWSTGPS